MRFRLKQQRQHDIPNIVLFFIEAACAFFRSEFLLLTGRYVKNNDDDKDLNEITGAVGTRVTEHHHLARRRWDIMRAL